MSRLNQYINPAETLYDGFDMQLKGRTFKALWPETTAAQQDNALEAWKGVVTPTLAELQPDGNWKVIYEFSSIWWGPNTEASERTPENMALVVNNAFSRFIDQLDDPNTDDDNIPDGLSDRDEYYWKMAYAFRTRSIIEDGKLVFQ